MGKIRRVGIAGGTGLLGSALIRHLARTMPSVRVTASYFSHKPFVRSGAVSWVKGDLRDEKACRKLFKGCDAAVLASVVSGGARFNAAHPWELIADNAAMYGSLIRACCELTVKQMVFCGSATVYQPHAGPVAENDIDYNADPAGNYAGFGWMMRYVEKLLQWASRECGMRVACARLSNLYGPFDRFDPGESHFIPALIRLASEKREPFEVRGRPGTRRDVVYADDAASAVVRMLSRKSTRRFEVFNVGGGKTVTVKECVDLALRHTGFSPETARFTGIGPAQAGRVLDCAKAKRLLGWEPRVSIAEGIGMTAEWWKSNKGWWKR